MLIKEKQMKMNAGCIAVALTVLSSFTAAARPEDYAANYNTPEEVAARFARPSKKVLFLGDSITDRRHIGCTKNYWGFLADRFGFNPYVYGINGQHMLNIPSQADRFAAENPGIEPDVVFVFAGTNDYNANVPLGEWYDYSEERTNRNGREVMLRKRAHNLAADTFRGRINRALGHLRERFPLSRIVLLTPIHRGYARFGEKNVQPDESYANELGLFIDDYVAVVKEAGSVWAAKVIDINSASGVYPNAPGQDVLIHDAETDRLHPSAAGHERIAEAIAAEAGEVLR